MRLKLRSYCSEPLVTAILFVVGAQFLPMHLTGQG
jgi:hypothetical protein